VIAQVTGPTATRGASNRELGPARPAPRLPPRIDIERFTERAERVTLRKSALQCILSNQHQQHSPAAAAATIPACVPLAAELQST
jgi:hypothetical protein